MPDIPTAAKALTLQTVGGNTNTWGTINNSNFSIADLALGGVLAKVLTGNALLTSVEARNVGYTFTGTLGAAVTVTWPPYFGWLFVENNASKTVTCGLASGAAVEVEPVECAWIRSDGTSFVRTSRYSTTVFDSRPIVIAPSTLGGYFFELDSKAQSKITYAEADDLSAFVVGAIRDGLMVNHIDQDTTAYATPINTSTAARLVCSGPFSGGVFQNGFRNVAALWLQAEGKSGNGTTGVGALLTNSIQHGPGICDNEFWAINPAGATQAASICPGQFVIQGLVADADGSHFSRGVIIENIGFQAGAGLYIATGAASAGDGSFLMGIDMSQALIGTGGVGIWMPRAAGTDREGSAIVYDTDDYSSYNYADNYFEWSIGATSALLVGEIGISVGTGFGAAALTLPTTDATRAAIQFQTASAPPGTPVDGMMWFDGTDWKVRSAGATKTVTIV